MRTSTKAVIQERALRRLLRTAAHEAVRETDRYCMNRRSERMRVCITEEDHERVLAWMAERLGGESRALLPEGTDPHAVAPIVCSIQEVVEWGSHMRRLECLGDQEYNPTLTWLPQNGAGVVGTSELTSAVEQRLDLLRAELSACGVAIVSTTTENGRQS